MRWRAAASQPIGTESKRDKLRSDVEEIASSEDNSGVRVSGLARRNTIEINVHILAATKSPGTQRTTGSPRRIHQDAARAVTNRPENGQGTRTEPEAAVAHP